MKTLSNLQSAGVDRELKSVTESRSSDQSNTSRGEHLPILDTLRGIAALSVCWFHYSYAQFTEQFSAYKFSGQYGWLGVQVFFVVSGFIVPYSLYRARYQLAYFFRFMMKRILRLDPPYLASILMVVAGYWVSSALPNHQGPRFQVNWLQVLSHLGYLNAFLGMPWLQMSYWSLAIEFQYYLAVGLGFWLLARQGVVAMAALFAVCGLSALAVPNAAFLPHHLPIFLLGFFAFRYKCLGTTRWEHFLSLILATALAYIVDGPLQAGCGLISCLTIISCTLTSPVFRFLGRISYSLYLVHVFVGQMVLGTTAKYVNSFPILKWIIPPCTIVFALLVAYLFYILIEHPAKMFSARIRYKARP